MFSPVSIFRRILLGYYAEGMHANFKEFDLNTANDGTSAKTSPFHALIGLKKNDCPYWLVVSQFCLNFILCFLQVLLYASIRTPSKGTCAKPLIIL